jgi:hypothetical protein
MRTKLAVGILIVMGFLTARTTSLAATLPPQPKTVTLVWNYPQASPDIVFRIYSTTNLAMPLSKWPVYTNLTTTSCVVQVSPGSRFFTVSASNTVTGSESFSSR